MSQHSFQLIRLKTQIRISHYFFSSETANKVDEKYLNVWRRCLLSFSNCLLTLGFKNRILGCALSCPNKNNSQWVEAQNKTKRKSEKRKTKKTTFTPFCIFTFFLPSVHYISLKLDLHEKNWYKKKKKKKEKKKEKKKKWTKKFAIENTGRHAIKFCFECSLCAQYRNTVLQTYMSPGGYRGGIGGNIRFQGSFNGIPLSLKSFLKISLH